MENLKEWRDLDSKSNSKEKEVQSIVSSDEPIDCQQEEENRSYRRFKEP